MHFGDSDTESLFRRERPRRLDPRILAAALRKLIMIDAAETLDDLKVSPGNRLEALKGAGQGQHSIRVNSQWRIVFVWHRGNAYKVSIVDYH